MTGVDRNNDTNNDMITVPVHYGAMDRIIANVLHTENQFAAQKLPLITGYLTSIELNREAKKARTHTETVYGNALGGPNANKSVRRVMGTPYRANMDLSIMTSNQEQMMQILEQIMLIFNPYISIQKSDDPIDWTHITYVELIGMNNEENIPMSVDDRAVVWTLNFVFDFWLNFPAQERNARINEIDVQIFDNTIVIDGI